MTPTPPHPKWRIAVVTLAVLALCYYAAGTPPVSPAARTVRHRRRPRARADHVSLAQPFRPRDPAADLYASRFYVLLLAALNMLACGFALHAQRSAKRFAFVLAWAVVMLVMLVNTQIHAFYKVA